MATKKWFLYFYCPLKCCKISLMTPHTLIALQVLPGTLLMTNTVEMLAKPFIEPLGLRMHETPYKLRHYNAKMYWHTRDHNDQGHQWLRDLIKRETTQKDSRTNNK